MLAVQQLGTSYYLRDTELMDWTGRRVSSVDLWRRLDYYNRMAESAPCPLCKQGTLPRSVIRLLLMVDAEDAERFHNSLIHGT